MGSEDTPIGAVPITWQQAFEAGLEMTTIGAGEAIEALGIDRREYAQMFARLLRVIREEHPDFDAACPPDGKAMEAVVELILITFMGAFAVGAHAVGNITLEADAKDVEKAIRKVAAERSGRLKNTNLVRNRRNAGRRLR